MSDDSPEKPPEQQPVASPFLAQHLKFMRERIGDAPVLDLACGRGRNALAAAAAGLRVVGVDRNRAFLSALGAQADQRGLRVERVLADLEANAEIPFRSASCAGILVFRFLYRPLAGAIERALAPGGLLLYETFTREQPALGWGPSNPRFLLEAGELPGLFPGLEVLDIHEGLRGGPRPEHCAGLLARKSTGPVGARA